MTNNRLFFSIFGIDITLFIAAMGFFEYYIDAKIDPVREQVGNLVQYMVSHEGKISRLEERTKDL